MSNIDPVKLLHTLAHLEDERYVKNPMQNHDKFLRYCKAIRLLKVFLANGRGTAEVDDVNIAMNYHSVRVTFIKDDFDRKEIEQLSEIMSQFDSMALTANCETGDVSFDFVMEDIYIEAK